MNDLRRLMAVCFLPLAFGCSPATDGEESSAGPRPSNATRSATCLSWQDATCDYLADTCQSVARDYCDDYSQSLFCSSDDTMQTCIDAMAKGSCPDTPDECTGVADTEPARWFCRSFVEVLCARGEACGLESKDQCVQGADSSLDCDAAVGAGPLVETCLSQLGSVSCGALQQGQLPAACQGVIKVDEAVPLTTSRRGGIAPMLRSASEGIGLR